METGPAGQRGDVLNARSEGVSSTFWEEVARRGLWGRLARGGVSEGAGDRCAGLRRANVEAKVDDSWIRVV